MTNVQIVHADGNIEDNVVPAATALDMFRAFSYEVDHPDEAANVRGDDRIVAVRYVTP